MLKNVFLVAAILLVMSCDICSAQTNSDNAFGSGVHDYFGGRYQKAIMSFDAAIAIDHKDARAYYFRGLARMASGDTYSAEGDFRQGALVESSTGKNRRSSLVTKSLERVQGSTRLKLETIRRDTILGPVQPIESIAKGGAAGSGTIISSPITPIVSQPIVQPSYSIPQTFTSQPVIVSQPTTSYPQPIDYPIIDQSSVPYTTPNNTIVESTPFEASPAITASPQTIITVEPQIIAVPDEELGSIGIPSAESSNVQVITPIENAPKADTSDEFLSEVETQANTEPAITNSPPSINPVEASSKQPEAIFGNGEPTPTAEASFQVDNSFQSEAKPEPQEPAKTADSFGADPVVTEPAAKSSDPFGAASPSTAVSSTSEPITDTQTDVQAKAMDLPDDPFGAMTDSTKPAPNATPAASSNDPFGSESGDDPFGGNSASDPFGAGDAKSAADSEPAVDTPNEPAEAKSADPFGSSTEAGGSPDSFGAEKAGAEPSSSSDDPFGSVSGDPFGSDVEAGSSADSDDPFGQ